MTIFPSPNLLSLFPTLSLTLFNKALIWVQIGLVRAMFMDKYYAFKVLKSLCKIMYFYIVNENNA